jgi:hypothetical protein
MNPVPATGPRRPSALPSVRARVLAFAAIVVMGVCGGLIGSSLVTVQCTGNCTTQRGLGAIIGAAVAAIGVAVMAVLTLRAMGEWQRISEEQLMDEDRPEAQEG